MVKNPLTEVEPIFVEYIDTTNLSAGYKNSYGVDICKYLRGRRIKLYKDPVTGYKFFYPFDLAGDDEMYEKLSRQDWYYMDGKWDFDEALKYIKPGDVVLEIGCGEGAFLKAATGVGAEATGLDINCKGVQSAKRKGLSAVCADVVEYSKSNQEKFDVICSFQLMEHIVNVREVL